jgi:hypothetical protein
MTSQAQQFRIRYFGRSSTVLEVETAARDTADAIRAAREAQWPPKALGFRLIDAEGREVFEQLKSDLRQG